MTLILAEEFLLLMRQEFSPLCWGDGVNDEETSSLHLCSAAPPCPFSSQGISDLRTLKVLSGKPGAEQVWAGRIYGSLLRASGGHGPCIPGGIENL